MTDSATTRTWGPKSEQLLRELEPQVLGVVARRFRDFSTAEDALQEAMLAAFRQWPREGIPENPRGWLIRVASRRMTDTLRSEMARRQRETAMTTEEDPAIEPAENIEADMDPEDTLVLLFMCCHPALSTSSAIALTLRAVGGLTTAEIANAFMVPEATMAQRISRAKQSIKASKVPFRLPTPQERRERLPAVLHVLYLIFSEGYASSIGPHLQRLDLAREAIRLTRSARVLLPEDAEIAGLLALMHAQGLELRNVNFLDVGKMRDCALGLTHSLRDQSAHADDTNLLDFRDARCRNLRMASRFVRDRLSDRGAPAGFSNGPN